MQYYTETTCYRETKVVFTRSISSLPEVVKTPKVGDETFLVFYADRVTWFSPKSSKQEHHAIVDGEWKIGRWVYRPEPREDGTIIVKRYRETSDMSCFVLRATEYYQKVS